MKSNSTANSPKLLESYGRLPIAFEANAGQTDTRVKFLSRGRGYTMFLTGDEAVLSLRSQDSGVRSQKGQSKLETRNWRSLHERSSGFDLESGIFHVPWLFPRPEALIQNPKSQIQNPPAPDTRDLKPDVLRMKLVGANPTARVTGLDELPGKSNYFIGNDPKKWRTNVASYAKVKYQGVYPGIDLVYYGSEGGQLEYDFVVAPGADPNAIAFEIDTPLTPGPSPSGRGWPGGPGEGSPRIDSNGDLVIATDAGDVRFHKPVVYQPDSPHPKSQIPNPKLVAGRFVLRPARDETGNSKLGIRSSPDTQHSAPDTSYEVAFKLGPYDKSRSLVIDPYVSFAAFLGGTGEEVGWGITVDSSGNVYVTGNTFSTEFPMLNPLQATVAGAPDAFVAKLNAEGTALVYSTYLGGTEHDEARAIAVDDSGNACVTGLTGSHDFPTMNPLQPTNRGVWTAFVAKLNPAGSALVYSTYLGGSFGDGGAGIAVDSSGDVYVTGTTDSVDFPTMNPLQPVRDRDAFISKLNAAGSALVYSTPLGGGSTEQGIGIAVDSSGSAYVTGWVYSTDFPIKNPVQATKHSEFMGDAFVTKLNAAGSALVYSTYLGGNDEDLGNSVALDASGNAYVRGRTSSTDFPTMNPYQADNHGNEDTFVAKLNAEGTALVYSTYLGGSGFEGGAGIETDTWGNVYVVGLTDSPDFPTMNALQSTYGGGGADAFVAVLDPAGSALLHSTYFGGNGTEYGIAIAVDNSRNAFITGFVESTDLLVTSDNFNRLFGSDGTYHGGKYDAIVMKISPGEAPQVGVSQISVTFPDQPSGTTSAPTPMIVGNFTSVPLDVTTIQVTDENGDPNPDFTVDPKNCIHTFAVGEKCVVDVYFTPQSGASPPALREFAGGNGLPALRSNPGTPPRLPSPRGTKTGALALTSAISSTSKTDTIPLQGDAISALANLDITSLDFDPQPVGTTSPAQSVTLTNVTDDLALAISSVSVSAGFGQTSNYASSVPIGGNCTFQITSSPTATGASNGTLTIATNAVDSPHVVTLSGNGTDFVLDVQSGGATSTTVTAGSTATFDLQIEPTGFVGNVSLGCAFQGSTPRGASCSVAPNVVALNGTDPGPFTVNVATTARSLAVPRGPELPPAPSLRHLVPVLLGLMLLAAVAAASRRRSPVIPLRGTALQWAPLGATLLFVLLWTACGGSGGGGGSTGTPAGNYSLTLTATAGGVSKTATLSLRVN